MSSTAPADTRPLVALAQLGQSIWLDFITRDLVRKGELRDLIEQDGLRGMTSNPTIFQKAIASGNAYDEQLQELIGAGESAENIFEALAVKDIQDACDLFAGVYESSNGEDGMVSIEVSPLLANDTQGTIDAGRRLWQAVNRPNVMIKVPGTEAGIPAIRQLIADGINVNVTLLFSIQRHEDAMNAYIQGLMDRAAAGHPVDRIASVASFFISRVDSLVDKLLDAKIADASTDADRARLDALKGKAAIANAKLAYARFRDIFNQGELDELRDQGARVQRPLWASTSTKNPTYRDVLYIEELIGPDTVNTVPYDTMRAFQDHGVVKRTIDQDVDAARSVLAALAEEGISYDDVTRQLEEEGVALFVKSFDDLIGGVQQKIG